MFEERCYECFAFPWKFLNEDHTEGTRTWVWVLEKHVIQNIPKHATKSRASKQEGEEIGSPNCRDGIIFGRQWRGEIRSERCGESERMVEGIDDFNLLYPDWATRSTWHGRLAGLDQHVMNSVKAHSLCWLQLEPMCYPRPWVLVTLAMRLLDLLQEISRTGLNKVVHKAIKLHMFSPAEECALRMIDIY